VIVTGVPVKLPGIHEYVVPEILFVAVREDEVPLHIEAGEDDAVMIRSGLKVTATEPEPVQPPGKETVTEYVPAIAGVAFVIEGF